MKTAFLLLTILGLAATTALAHGDKKVAGPHGGRILTAVTPHVEFHVNEERRVQFTFLDEHNQPLAPAAQSIIVTTGSRSAPLTLNFTRQGDRLIADAPLPAGRRFPAVIQIKPTPDAAPVIEKFTIDLATCGECGHYEHACTCDH